MKRFSTSIGLHNTLSQHSRAMMLRASLVNRSRASKFLEADDPFGEKASLGEEEYMYAHLSKRMDADRLEEVSVSSKVTENNFAQADFVGAMETLRRSMKIINEETKENEKKRSFSGTTTTAGSASTTDLAEINFPNVDQISAELPEHLSDEERLVLIAEHLTEEDRRIAEGLQRGITQWLSMSPAGRQAIRKEFRFTEKQRAQKDHWHNKSYSSYEEYIRREVIGVTADDVARSAAAAAVGDSSSPAESVDPTTSNATTVTAQPVDQYDGFEDDGDVLEDETAVTTDAADISLPMMTAATSSSDISGADNLIGDADAMRKELENTSGEECIEEEQPKQIFQRNEDGTSSYILPDTDPSNWNTEDVIAWLDCFCEEGLIDDEMIKTFRLANVDGDMLLNKVMPPNMFKVMRKWHLQRMNPKSRHLAEQLVVDTEMVQYTIYLCFPYCGQL